MKHKPRARPPPTTRNIPELGISTGIPLTEYRADVVSTRICVRGLWERQLAVVDPDWWR